jgi:glutathione S-transferase
VKIVIGNKNYSSWSLRPWLVLEHSGLPFEEQVIPLDQPDTAAEIARFSPAGRVPVLVDGDVTVWDSLAICEYLAEQHPEKALWPRDRAARAMARAVSAEMHSGFTGLRSHWPLKLKESFPARPPPQEAQGDIDRILAIWNDCRRRFGRAGPFLFGAFSIADAMYAPVVSRFRTYGLKPGGDAGAWADMMWALPAMQKWAAGARAETYGMKRYDAGARPTP